MSGRTGADSHARASADAHPLSDLGDLLAVVDDRSCLPTRATWRGVRFRFGGGVDPASTGCIRFSRGLLPMMSVWPSSTRPRGLHLRLVRFQLPATTYSSFVCLAPACAGEVISRAAAYAVRSLRGLCGRVRGPDATDA